MSLRARKGRKENKVMKLITPATFVLTAIQQATQKDVASSSSFANYSATQKAQFLAGSVVQKFTGVNLTPTLLTSQPMKINPAGVLNKWVGLGIGGLLVAKFLPVPAKAEINKVSKGALLGGIVGGIVDDPIPVQNSGLQTYAQQQSNPGNPYAPLV